MSSHYYITSNDSDQTLHCVAWEPATRPVAVLQLVHGMEEYIERYDRLAQTMVARGWAVVGHDHLGHGKSGTFLHAFEEEGRGAWLSRNRENVAQYKADPLCGFGFTCGAYRQMYENLMLVSRSYHYEQLVAMPMLVISGADDPVGGTRGVKKIAADYRRRGFTDVTEKCIAHDRHEILFEQDAEETMRFIADWLDRSLSHEANGV